MTDGSDYSNLMPHLHEAFQRYYNLGHAAFVVEMMKCSKETGDISMETINIVLLDPTSYKFLSALIPFLQTKVMQEHLVTIIEEMLAREQKGEDSDPDAS